ncbi:M15 family metallopeptidase [uncultured Deinococcus sp.]|uniref:M15 family metallopeptidase n=1 Tax=uncultured Deinococcus sp. TaxID=158789 RepID=UPI0025E9BE53|nr:M15 family metallopeptidase [uncultured Deinococcus sp.]
MTPFDFAAAIAARPGGATRAELVAAYGDPFAGCTRTAQGQFTPSAAFAAQIISLPTANLPGFPPFGTQPVATIRLHREVAPVFAATWAELDRRGLTRHLHTYSGSTVFRHMLWNYANPVSLHAYGAAIDFDAGTNGYGLPPARMQMNLDVVRCFEECGWHWGGRWNPTDGMHFQWTDPLPGVPVMPWQDALGRATPPTSTAPIPFVKLIDQQGRQIETPYLEARYRGLRFKRVPGGIELFPEDTQ